MATKTLHRIINGQNDVAAVLSNSSLCRLMSIGSNWQRIRVALRLRVTDSGANVQASPVFVVGVCAGTSHPFNNGAASTQHFFGCYENGTTWTRCAATGDVPVTMAQPPMAASAFDALGQPPAGRVAPCIIPNVSPPKPGAFTLSTS
jgi:hypothetical protein